MPIRHVSRNGKIYYLHADPKRGGGTQLFFSTKTVGTLAQRLPEGFEVYETVNGQVYPRRQQPKLIRDDERDCIARQLEKLRAGKRYKIEVCGEVLTVHESNSDFGWLAEIAPHLSRREREASAELSFGLSAWSHLGSSVIRSAWRSCGVP